MNEERQTPKSDVPSASPHRDQSGTSPSSPRFGLMFLLGIVLIFVAWGLSYLLQNPMPFFFTGIGAFFTVFFKGYRGIFVGFITTIGVVLLGAIIYCANHPFNV